MSVRVLLSVVLAAALVAAAAPGVDSARTAHAEHAADAGIDEVADAIVALQRNDPAPTLDLAARRVVRVRLPDRPSLGADPVLVVGAAGSRDPDARPSSHVDDRMDGPRSDVLVSHAGGRQRVRRVHVDVRTLASEPAAAGAPALAADDEGLRVAGDTTIVLAYVERAGRPTVVVREFIPGDGTNASHASRLARPVTT